MDILSSTSLDAMNCITFENIFIMHAYRLANLHQLIVSSNIEIQLNSIISIFPYHLDIYIIQKLSFLDYVHWSKYSFKLIISAKFVFRIS